MSNNPSDTLPAVDAMRKYWDVITPLMGGTMAMRAAGKSLLPQYPAEADESYKERLRLSTLLPAYSETVGNMTSRVFAEPLQVGDEVPDQIKEMSKDIDLAGNTAKQNAAALRGVPAQFTDIFTSIAAGQPITMVALQQGGQLKDMFGGIGPAARALGGYILGLVNPFTVAAAAVGALTLAYYKGSQEADEYNKAIIFTGIRMQPAGRHRATWPCVKPPRCRGTS